MSAGFSPILLLVGAVLVALSLLVVGFLLVGKQGKRSAREDRVPPAPPSPEVVEMVRTGQKIAAIKRYREETGARLAEAKRAIESAD